ncbi:low affinity immunoglobulin epsilon Fc receptor-like [Amphiura filiformis]|uniref:low affinity immunoglobulin epsilon Fc receptor-like n=1 Tax=Amphiura filiformis TaxID=82378 RepID=UPI003B21DBCC
MYQLGERACLTDWSEFENTCYFVSTVDKPFSDSLTTCEDFGGSLVSIHSQSEQDFVTGIIPSSGSWIGLNDIRNESYFLWTDGTEVNFTAWSPGEPNDYGDGEDCTQLADFDEDDIWMWNDYPCHGVLPLICKQAKHIDLVDIQRLFVSITR